MTRVNVTPPTPVTDTTNREAPTMPLQAPSPSRTPFDMAALRLPANYGATLGVKKILMAVPVGKPSKARFFRVRPGVEWSIPVFIVELKEERETYIVTPGIAPILGDLVKPAQIYVAIDRNDNPFLIPIPLPGEDGRRNPWHESLAQAIGHAEKKWVRIAANMSAGSYDVLEAQGTLTDPTWPDLGIEKLIEIAFRGKIISDDTHPVVQALLGRV
jgi:hypothetical protein